MDFIGDVIEITGAWFLRLFRSTKTDLNEIINSERLKVWIVGLSAWLIVLTIFGAIAKFGF